MADYIFLMHDDAVADNEAWEPYIRDLKERGLFQGGSAIGGVLCTCKEGEARPVTAHLAGYIRVSAESIEQAKSLLTGNPQFEAGGTVEIRVLPPTD